MSSGDPATRKRILRAAWDLLESADGTPITMGDVAERAGVSRQALYLHFADRTDLIVEASRLWDATLRGSRQRRIDEAPTARQGFKEAIRLQAWLKPRLQGVATALEVLRRSDPAADAAWKEREHARLTRCEELIQRLAEEGELAAGWDQADAARCFWAATSQRVWEDLVIDQRWSNHKYRAHLTTLLEASLLRSRDPSCGETVTPKSRRGAFKVRA
ncbi:MAG: TetR/AcrR family transcriptional regulator [Actinomycetota bacterium]|nr:TetR/AcrR family transcriptional regulator [Actinomycetota bacterium]